MNIIKKSISAFLGLALVYTVTDQYYLSAKADDATVLVTEYSDLWSGNISIKTGDTVKWYVNVPEGTEPKGCGATIKIPGLGFGTDADNKDEKHISLVQGENFIYEFTPEAERDILFTCRMGSSCHHNYIHVTDDGTYKAAKPSDVTNISAEWKDADIKVSFTVPEAPEGVKITGYKVTATDENGKRKKLTVKDSPAVFEGLEADKTYTFKVITLATSGDSAGANEYVLADDANKSVNNTTEASESSNAVTTYAISDSSTSTTTTTASVKRQSSPKTGVTGIGTAESVFGISTLLLLLSIRSKRKNKYK
ncbi:MAG: fibronectin type III domain-containing protein [Ruminococcus sp.]|nr:fibronectin type III domain-containing protein [Ruminococcus sp.]